MARYRNGREICVGDVVRYVGRHPQLENRTGHVVAVERCSMWDCAVEWNEWTGGHHCDGRARDYHGLYVDASEIEFISSDAAVADDEARCYECGGLFVPSRLGMRLYKDTHKCVRCITREISSVHGYHFGKRLCYNTAKDKITLGVEVEIDGGDSWGGDFRVDSRDNLARDCVEYAVDNDYALVTTFESDGSLCDGGVECVSAPLTIDEWKSEEVREQYEHLFNTAYDYDFDFSRHNNAGLHVHIGRKDLCGDNKSVSDAVGLLMGWAVTRLWARGLCDLAGRDENEYTHALNHNDELNEQGGNGLQDTGAMYGRYYFVNIQNHKTLELRIFNRATCYEDILVAVDVCYMLGKWATKKINAFLKRNSYSAKAYDFTDALAYADRVTWDALVKYSKFPEVTLLRMREAGIKI